MLGKYNISITLGTRIKQLIMGMLENHQTHSELFLSVDNTSGAVLLEKPGYAPQRQVTGSLAEFLEELVPAPPALHP